MCWRHFRFLAFSAIALLAASPAHAKLKLKYVHHGPITVEMRYDPRGMEADPDIPPKVTVYYLKRKVAGLVLDGSIGKPDIFVVQMDPANRAKEVLVGGYSGGAHCCTSYRVITALPGQEERRWKVISLGEFDGGTVEPKDLDGDGLAELRLHDDRFLYRYDCYACSYAPPMILSVREGRKVNLTRRRAFRPLLREAAERVRRNILSLLKESPEESPNGLLAGYVAVETLLGRGPAAWRFMLEHHKPQPQEYCPMPKPNGVGCAVRPLEISFPLELSIFLRETGYVVRRD